MTDEIRQRKADHLDLCATDQVAFRGQTTLLSQVRLVHQSLPELSLDELDLSTELLGKVLRAPLVIAAMTGGHERAEEINRTLAGIAERRGYAFGLGSQRAMVLRPEAASTYRVRDVAPTALVDLSKPAFRLGARCPRPTWRAWWKPLAPTRCACT